MKIKQKLQPEKLVLKKRKKIATPRIFGRFKKNFRRTCLLLLVVDARSAEKIRLVFLSKRSKLSKNQILDFFFFLDFALKISFF